MRGIMGASNGRAHYLADHLLWGGRTCLSVPDSDTVNRPPLAGENLPGSRPLCSHSDLHTSTSAPSKKKQTPRAIRCMCSNVQEVFLEFVWLFWSNQVWRIRWSDRVFRLRLGPGEVRVAADALCWRAHRYCC